VLNWSISREDKAKLTKCQNHHHHGGVFDTWTVWVKPQAERAQGLAGWPNSLADWPCFMSVRPMASRTHVYTRSRKPKRWRKSVEAAPPSWSATTWCQTNFSKFVELPHCPINTPYGGNVDTHTPHFRYSTCKDYILSVVARRRIIGRVVRL
jgi:hypothetical protein